MQKVWIIWPLLLYLNFKTFLAPSSSSLIRFQFILHDSGVLFSESWNFYKIKGEPISQKVWSIWSPFLYFNFKSFMYPNFLSFVTFQCILYDSLVLFSESWTFYKLKREDLICRGNQFSRKSELFGPPFCIWILKVF